MREAAWLSLLLAASCLGFACLALSLPRHWRDVSGKAALSRRAVIGLRACGYFALAVSLAFALLRDGPSFGGVLWILALAVAAATVAFTLTWRLEWLRVAVRAAPRRASSRTRASPTNGD